MVQLSGPAETLEDLVEALDGLHGWEIATSITKTDCMIYNQAALILTHTPDTVEGK